MKEPEENTVYRVKNELPLAERERGFDFYNSLRGCYVGYIPWAGSDRSWLFSCFYFQVLSKDYGPLNARARYAAPLPTLMYNDMPIIAFPLVWIEPLPAHEELMISMREIQLRKKFTKEELKEIL